jgi:cytochrome c biogenesis protein
VTVTERGRRTVFRGPTPFLPADAATYLSNGVIKVPAAQPQLGFSGFFVPTAALGPAGIVSVFPAPDNPRLVLTAYRGDLGLSSGTPQNVYRLDTSRMTQITAGGRAATKSLAVGQRWRLPDGVTVRFDGVRQFANLHVTSNPGKRLVLVATITLIVGLILSLTGRRRRLWIRLASDTDGTKVSAGGLGRSESASTMTDFQRTVYRISKPIDPRTEP